MNLWHVDDATRELAVAKDGLSATDVNKQEKDHFDQGVTFYQAKDFDKARKEFRAVVDLNIAGSTLKPQADGYIGKIQRMGNDQKVYDAAVQAVKEEKWAEARDQFQEVINRKAAQSGDAKKQLPTVEKPLQIMNSFEEALKSSSFKAAKAQLDLAQPWNKTHETLQKELHAAEQREFDTVRNNAQAAESKGDTATIQRAQDEVHGFEGRVEDSGLLSSAHELDKRLADSYTKAAEKNGDKAAFDTAVEHFGQAQRKKDADQLSHAVTQEFQKIAKGSVMYHDQALLYLNKTIPTAIQEIKQTAGKLVLQALSCGPSHSTPEFPSVTGTVSCAQLDATAPLQWVGPAAVDFPDIANQPGKLPYSLTVIVTIEPNGNVKIDKEGNPDKDFFKKVKDGSKHLKATVPTSGGKPVTVRFPMTITFQR